MYPYSILKPSVVLQLILIVADCFSVVTAEVSITVLHLLPNFSRELHTKSTIYLGSKASTEGLFLSFYLCDQDVGHSVNHVVLVARRHEVFPPPLLEARQETCVKVEEVFQAWEQTVQSAGVHLEVLPQLSDVHAQHYLQCSDMVHLRLHQLCGTTPAFSFELPSLIFDQISSTNL